MEFLWCTEKVLHSLLLQFSIFAGSRVSGTITLLTVTHLLVLDQTQFIVGLNWKEPRRSNDLGNHTSSGSPDSPFEKQLVCGSDTHSDS